MEVDVSLWRYFGEANQRLLRISFATKKNAVAATTAR